MPKLPVGAFVTEHLAAGKQLVAKSRNTAGYAALIAQVAHSVMNEYPTLSTQERAAVLATLTREAETQKEYPTMALREASRVLGIPGTKEKKEHGNV